MQDAWRAYLEMALGLTEAPRKKAQKVAGELVNRGGATAVQLQGLVEDLMSTGMANREALTNIVRFEVDRALGAVGLATADEVAGLTSRVHDLERQLREAQARATAAEAAPAGARVEKPAPTPPPAKKAVAKKAVAKKAAEPAAPADVPTPAAMPVKKTAAKKALKKVAPGTATPPVAPVTEAASRTTLPDAGPASAKLPAARKKAAPKKTAPKPATPEDS